MTVISWLIFGALSQSILFATLILKNKAFRSAYNRHFAFFLIIIFIMGFDSLLLPYFLVLGGGWFTFYDVVGDDIPWITAFYVPLFTFFQRATCSIIKIPIYWFYLPFAILLGFNLLIDLHMDFALISVPALVDNRGIVYLFEDYVALGMFIPMHLRAYFFVAKKPTNKWLNKLWWFSSILITLMFINHVFLEFEFNEFTWTLWFLLSVFVYWYIYSQLLQFNIGSNRKEIKAKIAETADEKHSTNKRKSQRPNTHFGNLLNLLEEDKIYRDENLSREIVSQKLGISNSYLTQLIKENSESSFTDLVNQYRIKDVEQMLQDPAFKNFDVLSIGLEAGFKSKSSFYSTFKKHHRISPSQFRKRTA